MPDLAYDLAQTGPVVPSAEPFPGGFWPGTEEGTFNADAIAPAAVVNVDFDLSACPNNAAAVIQWSLVMFGVSAGFPGVNCQTGGIALAYRDNAGNLQTDPFAMASIAAAVPLDPLGGFGMLSLPGGDILRMPLTNGGHTSNLRLRYAIAYVPAGAALG